MSHDRGCSCGREKYEYDDCPDPDCWHRLRTAELPTAEGAKSVSYDADPITLEPSKANTHQVGGDHYRSDYQHWDLIEEHGIGYLEAAATKYVSRWRSKNGVQDLRKARHYGQKLAEMHANGQREPRGRVPEEAMARFITANKLDSMEAVYISLMCNWQGLHHLQTAEHLLDTMIADAEDAEKQMGKPYRPAPLPPMEGNDHVVALGEVVCREGPDRSVVDGMAQPRGFDPEQDT